MPRVEQEFAKQAANLRREAANETSAALKAELLLYAAEFETKARKRGEESGMARSQIESSA